MNQYKSRAHQMNKGREVIWQQAPIKVISLICFHLNRSESGKDDSSSSKSKN